MSRFICCLIFICMTSLAYGAEKNYVNSIGMEFVLIPAGSFTMGNLTGKENERIVHKVNITKDFYIGKFEVTQEQWQKIMSSNPSYFQGSKVKNKNHMLPVENVSWDYIKDFISKLNASEGVNAYRLPTEAEWEYVARSGSKSIFNDKSIGGNAWYVSNSKNQTQVVGKKSPNALGVYDILGNVNEWVEDTYISRYKSEEANDPIVSELGFAKVIRGGSWADTPQLLTVHNRQYSPPYFRSDKIGFRLVKSIE